MLLHFSYMDTFQSNGPFHCDILLNVETHREWMDRIQNASNEDMLRKVLEDFIRSDLFATHISDNWKWPIRDTTESMAVDNTPSDLRHSMLHWFEWSMGHHRVAVFRKELTTNKINEVTAYYVEESITGDGFEDRHLEIIIQHDDMANPRLMEEHKVLTKEEEDANRQHDDYMDSLWDD